jgi:hypothetical protein
MMHGKAAYNAHTSKYLDETIPPVVMLIKVFAEWFKGGGDCRHHTVIVPATRDWSEPTDETKTTTTTRDDN